MPQTSTRLLDLDALRNPTAPRDAATVIVVRDSSQGLQVFCVLRHVRSGFLGGAVVFPGGKVDASDALIGWEGHSSEPHRRVSELATATLSARTLAITACRETFEEGAILPTDQPLGAIETERMAEEVRAHRITLLEALARDGRRLALDALIPWGRWITPEAESRRFDARFFLLALPPGQVGRHDDHETTMSFWAAPAEVLERFVRGEIFLAPPTTRTLELLTSAANVSDAMKIAERQSLRPICPRFIATDARGEGPYLALPGDPAHEVRETHIDGTTRFVLREGIFVSEAEGTSSLERERRSASNEASARDSNEDSGALEGGQGTRRSFKEQSYRGVNHGRE